MAFLYKQLLLLLNVPQTPCLVMRPTGQVQPHGVKVHSIDDVFMAYQVKGLLEFVLRI
jgi:hypothetical protein